MTVLAIRDLTLRIAGRALLESADLVVDPGRKVGLVGRNGAGRLAPLDRIVLETPEFPEAPRPAPAPLDAGRPAAVQGAA